MVPLEIVLAHTAWSHSNLWNTGLGRRSGEQSHLKLKKNTAREVPASNVCNEPCGRFATHFTWIINQSPPPPPQRLNPTVASVHPNSSHLWGCSLEWLKQHLIDVNKPKRYHFVHSSVSADYWNGSRIAWVPLILSFYRAAAAAAARTPPPPRWFSDGPLSPQACCASWRPACAGGPWSPPGTPACPGGSGMPRSWPWTGCTCCTARVSARPRTASRATGGRGPPRVCASQSGRSAGTSCTGGRPPRPSPSHPGQNRLGRGEETNTLNQWKYTNGMFTYKICGNSCPLTLDLPILRKSDRYWQVIPKPKSLQNPASFLWFYLKRSIMCQCPHIILSKHA